MNSDKTSLRFVSAEEVRKENERSDDVFFSHISILGSDGYNMYYGRTQNTKIDKEAILKDLQLIPRENIYPRFSSDLTRAPEIKLDMPPPEIYIKTSRLGTYSQDYGQLIANLVLNEAEIYEILRKHPHPGLGRSLGCIVADDGLITGLALMKYDSMDLSYRASDPKSFGKEQRKRCIEALKDAVQHLHDLGLAHNDLNPMNVLFTDDGQPVLIDFETCCPIGTKLTKEGDVGGWEDGIPVAKYKQSSADCDKAQIEFLSAWLERKYEQKRLENDIRQEKAKLLEGAPGETSTKGNDECIEISDEGRREKNSKVV